MIPRFSLGVFSSLLNKETKNKREKKVSIYAMHLNVSRYGAPKKKVTFSPTNNCYTSKVVSKQSQCPGYVSQRQNICVGRIDLNQSRAERLKCEAHQLRIMWGGWTLGRMDRHTCMWSKANRTVYLVETSIQPKGY